MYVSRWLISVAFMVLPSLARAQGLSSAVIRSSVSTDSRESRLQVLPSGELVAHSIPVIELLSLAYDVPANPSPRLASMPEWTAGLRFDIQARISVLSGLDSKDVTTQKKVIQGSIRRILAERFGLVLKVKTERREVYALYVAKHNPRLSRVANSDCIFDTNVKGCHSFASGYGHPLNARAVDMSDLANYLENWTDLPVVDRTALPGLFAMHSQGWRPMNLPPPPPGTAASGAEFISLQPLSTVLFGFGLALRRQEENIPFYTVERIHQPNTN